MFCFQCQESINGVGCEKKAGYCGKTEEVAELQDILVYLTKGLASVATKARQIGVIDNEVDRFVCYSLFVTITNANFDKNAILQNIEKALILRDSLKKKAEHSGITFADAHDCVNWRPANDDSIEAKAKSIGVLSTANEDIRSLKELIIYGVKGMAAYTEHAANLGFEDENIYSFIENTLSRTLEEDITIDELIKLTMETGKYGVEAMALLDKANTTSYGNPEITKVNIGVGTNPGILISGHDLKDIEELLKQTEGTGVDVYTHSEMLPAHYYPAFKKYSHFIGNYGSSWWRQTEEFESFNGPILFTTNCLVPPKSNAGYSERVYTTGAAGFSGFKHIEDRKPGAMKDFSPIIEHAKKCAPPKEIEKGEIVGGFAHNQVLALADKIIDAVKTGAIKKFVVMAGCDGRMKSREYYTEFAQKLPKDTVILTAGCAKYRYNKLPLGDIGGIPRVIDAGQCNDSYSLAVVALKLKEVFGFDDINKLPIVYNIAWYEQKAVIVLLALLYLGVKNIHLGPTLPAFLSPNIAKFLEENFEIAGIGNVSDDLKTMMN
jgi:hydroxylamine reductase